MAKSLDHETRITALEAQVTDLDGRVGRTEQDVASANELAGRANRAVTDLRTELRDFREHNARLHNATRQDIRDMRQDIRDMRQDLTGQRQDLTGQRQDLTDLRSHVEAGFIEMRGKFDATAAGLQQIVGMLNTLIARDDR